MTTWTNNELNKIGTAEELQIASFRRDGTQRNLVTIWVVRLGDDLYIRSVNGRTSAWFRGVQTRYEGHVARAAWIKTSSLWKSLTPTLMILSMPHTAQSIAATLQASSATLQVLRRDLRQSNFCHVQQALN